MGQGARRPGRFRASGLQGKGLEASGLVLVCQGAMGSVSLKARSVLMYIYIS